MDCVICQAKILPNKIGWTKGHNALPIKDGRCCDTCNQEVIEERIKASIYPKIQILHLN